MFHLNDKVSAISHSVESHKFAVVGVKSQAFKLYFIAFQKSSNMSCFTASWTTVGFKSSTLKIFCTASCTLFFESFIIFCNKFDAGSTSGINHKANNVRREKYTIVNAITTLPICISKYSKNTIIKGKHITHTIDVTKLKKTCHNATCFLTATLSAHIAHKTIVIVEPK